MQVHTDTLMTYWTDLPASAARIADALTPAMLPEAPWSLAPGRVVSDTALFLSALRESLASTSPLVVSRARRDLAHALVRVVDFDRLMEAVTARPLTLA